MLRGVPGGKAGAVWEITGDFPEDVIFEQRKSHPSQARDANTHMGRGAGRGEQVEQINFPNPSLPSQMDGRCPLGRCNSGRGPNLGAKVLRSVWDIMGLGGLCGLQEESSVIDGSGVEMYVWRAICTQMVMEAVGMNEIALHHHSRSPSSSSRSTSACPHAWRAGVCFLIEPLRLCASSWHYRD